MNTSTTREDKRARNWPCAPRTQTAFTLIELLVVIAIIAILAAMLLPGLSRAKMQGLSTSCMNNIKQLDLAWLSYASDNQNKMPPNWVSAANAWIDGAIGDVSTPQGVTNLQPILKGLLYSFCPNYNIYHCPANTIGSVLDPSLRNVVPIRNYSIEGRMGGAHDPSDDTTYVLTAEYPEYSKMDQVMWPAPSQAINFVDESCNTIDDGYFAMQTVTTMWQNSPTARHLKGTQFGFADGHAEHWTWQVLSTEQDLNASVTAVHGQNTESDLIRVQNAVFLRQP